MHTIEHSLDVNVPVRVAYNQWTQFEEFPTFMSGVKEVRQLDDRRLAWRAEVMGKEVAWTAEITYQIPDARIAWHSTSGAEQHGAIAFSREGASKTKLTLRIEFEPQDRAEATASALGLVAARVHGDLKRFKKFIEERGVATGRWRGEISGDHVTPPTAAT